MSDTTSPNLYLLSTLKSGVTPAGFENQVRETDQPATRCLARGADFRTYRAERLLTGEGERGNITGRWLTPELKPATPCTKA